MDRSSENLMLGPHAFRATMMKNIIWPTHSHAIRSHSGVNVRYAILLRSIIYPSGRALLSFSSFSLGPAGHRFRAHMYRCFRVTPCIEEPVRTMGGDSVPGADREPAVSCTVKTSSNSVLKTVLSAVLHIPLTNTILPDLYSGWLVDLCLTTRKFSLFLLFFKYSSKRKHEELISTRFHIQQNNRALLYSIVGYHILLEANNRAKDEELV